MKKFVSRVLTAVSVLVVITVPTLAKTVSATASINEYPMRYGGRPERITAGPDGNVWFTSYFDQLVAKITPSGNITEYPVLNQNDNFDPDAITTGPDGNLWFTGFDGIGTITTSGSYTLYPLQSVNGERNIFPDITTGPDGNLWFTTYSNVVASMTTAGVVTTYVLPPQDMYTNGITSGPDGALWFTTINSDNGVNYIGRITTSGVVTNYSLPTGADPISITTGPDGNLWFTDPVNNAIGSITTSGIVTEYPVPTPGAGPNDITNGPDGALWFTEGDSSANNIGRITTSGVVTEYPIPTPDASPIGITTGPDANLWFAEASANQIGQVVLSSSPTITSPQIDHINARAPINFTVTTTGNPTPSITESGTIPPGISFTDNGDGTATFSGQASTTNTGYYFMTLTATNSAGSASQEFVMTVDNLDAAPTFLNTNSLTETYGTPFSFTVDTTGVPIPNISRVDGDGVLPTGVSLVDNNDGTATLSGTPSGNANSVYTFTIKAHNSSGDAYQVFTMTIDRAPTVANVPNETLNVGTAFSLGVSTLGYPYPAFSVTGLPAGLSLTDNGDGTGTISGTPSVGSGGVYTVVVTATNGLGTNSNSATFKVDEVPVITSNNSATATRGSAFSFQVTSTGYPAPDYALSGATLPAGLRFNAETGVFSGTPRTTDMPGTYVFTITATNSTGSTTQAFTLTLN